MISGWRIKESMDSVQPLSVVLERKPWIRVLSLSRAAKRGCTVMEAFPIQPNHGIVSAPAWSPRVIGRGFRLKVRRFRLVTAQYPRQAQMPSRSLPLFVRAGRFLHQRRARHRGQVRSGLSPGGRWIRTSSSATNSQRLGSRSTQWCGLDRSDPRTTRGNC
jgi:hypothetical protein